jgi:hypothetical protein
MNLDLRQPRWSWLAFALVSVLLLAIVASCGSGDDDDDDDTTSGAATTSTTTGSATNTTTTGASDSSPTAADTTEEATPTSASAEDDATGDVGAVGACFTEAFTSDVVNDLREGNTESANAAFNDCIEGTLPESLASQAEPVVDQATTCAETASQDLGDEDVIALESGDTAVAEQLANDTLTCVSDELGIDLSGM